MDKERRREFSVLTDLDRDLPRLSPKLRRHRDPQKSLIRRERDVVVAAVDRRAVLDRGERVAVENQVAFSRTICGGGDVGAGAAGAACSEASSSEATTAAAMGRNASFMGR